MVVSTIAFGDGIGHWALVIGNAFRRVSFVVCRLNKSVAKQRKPKFSILNSQFSINSWDSNPTLHNSRFLVTSYSLLVSTIRFLTHHSLLLTFLQRRNRV